MSDRTALSMEIALGVAISQYPTGTFFTVRADRGKEFACYANLETSHDLHVYFAGSLDLFNHRPRKCLGWGTADESFAEELALCLTICHPKKESLFFSI